MSVLDVLEIRLTYGSWTDHTCRRTVCDHMSWYTSDHRCTGSDDGVFPDMDSMYDVRTQAYRCEGPNNYVTTKVGTGSHTRKITDHRFVID